MRPVNATVRASAILGIRLGAWRGDSATFRCADCGKSRLIEQPGVLTILLLFGLASLFPLLRPSQFSTLGSYLYFLLPACSLYVYFRLLQNRRRHPEFGEPLTTESPVTDARFVVGSDGVTKDEHNPD